MHHSYYDIFNVKFMIWQNYFQVIFYFTIFNDNFIYSLNSFSECVHIIFLGLFVLPFS